VLLVGKLGLATAPSLFACRKYIYKQSPRPLQIYMSIQTKIGTPSHTPFIQYFLKLLHLFQTTTLISHPNFHYSIAIILTAHLIHPNKTRMEPGEENEQDTESITLVKIYKSQKDCQAYKISLELNY
jgi:hypothetical protein